MSWQELHKAKLEGEREGFWHGLVLSSIAYGIALLLLATFGGYSC